MIFRTAEGCSTVSGFVGSVLSKTETVSISTKYDTMFIACTRNLTDSKLNGTTKQKRMTTNNSDR